MTNSTSRKRVATQRIEWIDKEKLPKAKTDKTRQKWEEEKATLNKIVEVADQEIQADKAREEQKKELAQDYKDLETKRAETPYKETKKEITKKMDKISDEFDKLTEEEFADTYEKPEEVIEEEANEQAGKDEFNKAMNENETPQKTEAEVEKKYVEPVETFYHASDTAIDTFDLSKTKPDQNGIGLAVNTKSENAYKDKPNQYEFN